MPDALLYFSDIYEWTGQPRIINVEKAESVLGGLPIEYTGFQDIRLMASSAISKMKAANCVQMTLDERA
ncbi:conserved protein of unknown function [Tepidanaerobacter acetatoxydans Re1]|uniref:Uncharacterized protein n=1 Tax=Tepidanaerobacter acetatoxydans (strain DSM 21804 / JCM 16047 / Re1) TaxID=1209989 RepID=U4Q959_TEPAE|nr:conserved protein of unknown function [Tepidanaerobacter acetatoxydans Re1]